MATIRTGPTLADIEAARARIAALARVTPVSASENLSRLARRNWVGALVGIVPFVVALYFFLQNVNRLLPAAL